LKVIDLDAIDLWEFANHEGLGDWLNGVIYMSVVQRSGSRGS
jgi:hypothetical protein